MLSQPCKYRASATSETAYLCEHLLSPSVYENSKESDAGEKAICLKDKLPRQKQDIKSQLGYKRLFGASELNYWYYLLCTEASIGRQGS